MSSILLSALALALPAGASARTAPDPSKACGALFGAQRLTAPAVPGSVAAAQLAAYGVLRRAATPADVPSLAGTGLTLGQLAGELARYDPAEVRLVGRARGQSVYLVPGAGRGFHLSAACRRALPNGLATLLAEGLRAVGHGPAYCLLEISQPIDGALNSDCSSFARNAGGFDIHADHPSHRPGILFGLVPDGVGAVSLSFVGAAAPLVAPVAENLFVGPAPARFGAAIPVRERTSPSRLRRLIDRVLPRSIAWLSAPGGAAVRVFPRPPGLLARTVRLALLVGRLPAALRAGLRRALLDLRPDRRRP